MMYSEIAKDLFEVDDSYHLAHCISSDAKMGAGIAVDFKKKFKLGHMTDAAKTNPYPVGKCIEIGRVFNLITKKVYYGKPSYETFRAAIEDMRNIMVSRNIRKVAMPQIGAGLDRLSWGKNREIIKEVFADTDFEILVCRKP